jgi:uncharacterized protein
VIPRQIETKLLALARTFPAVTVTGPRQSGKTTLCRACFPDKPYVSLERPDVRDLALSDPVGFLAGYPEGAVFDEVQHVPLLPSYLQGMIDDRPEPGRFILTGSQHFGLLRSVSQSLAGRTGLLQLLPLSLDEVRRFPSAPTSLLETLFAGGYPAIPERGVAPGDWHAAYVGTYVERDVRAVLGVQDLGTFRSFTRLCAGRTGQLLNVASLAADAGIAHGTAKAWLGVLEASFLLMRLPAWHRNLGKRLVKAPKLHFVDSGLCCWLLGIRAPDQLATHPLRGSVFESWVAMEIVKQRYARGLPADLHHYRDRKGEELDLVLDRGDATVAVEVKAGATVFPDLFVPLERFAELVARAPDALPVERVLVHGGDDARVLRGGRAVPWGRVGELDWCGGA